MTQIKRFKNLKVLAKKSGVAANLPRRAFARSHGSFGSKNGAKQLPDLTSFGSLVLHELDGERLLNSRCAGDCCCVL